MSGLPPLPLESLFRLKEWQRVNGDHFTLSNLLSSEGHLEMVIACSDLFWPTFVEIQGCIIRVELGQQDEAEAVSRWIEATNGRLSSVEWALNHIHIYDLFPTVSESEYPLVVHEYVAAVILQSWRAALSAQFPDKHFKFQYLTEPDDYGPTVYVWQDRQDGGEPQGASV